MNSFLKHTFASLLTLGLLFCSALPGYSKSAEEAELQGESAQKKGDLDLAIASFSEAIGLDPNCIKAYNNRGLVYHMKRDCDRAIADFSEAIRLDPKCAEAYDNRAEAYEDKGDFDRAIADYTEIIRFDPKSALAYTGRANEYGRKGDHDRAIADANQAIRLDPKFARAYNALGIAYDGYAKEMSSAEAAAAEALFDRAARNFDGPPRKLDGVHPQLPFDGSVENFRAAARQLDRAHKVQLLFDYSGAAFKAGVDAKPDYAFGNNNLGVYYARLRNLPLAEKYFRGAVSSDRRYADAFNNLGIVLRLQGAALRQQGQIEEAGRKLDDAIVSHKKGLELRNNRASDHNNLCRTYIEKGDLDAAAQENKLALKCDPNFLDAWSSRSEIFFRQDKFDDAATCVLRMAAIDSKSPQTIAEAVSFAGKCTDRKRYDQAIDFLSDSLKVNDAAPEIYHARAVAYFRKGDLKRAQQDFEQVLRIRPDYPGARDKLNAVRAKLANPR